jgi:hypothetical protein
VTSTAPTPKPRPTVIDEPATDLQLETPGVGLIEDGYPVVSPDGSKLLFRTDSQSVVPGGFLGDVAWVRRDRTTGHNDVIWSQGSNRFFTYPQTAGFLPDGSVAFNELGYWLPEPADALLVGGDEMVSEVFRWDLGTHQDTVMSLGADGKPIAVYPEGVPTPPGAPVFQADGPRNLRVTPDGRYLFFETAVPLGPEDPPGLYSQNAGGSTLDLFRRDMTTGEIVKVDVGNHPELGALANGGTSDVHQYDVSADGRYVAFAVPATGGLADSGACPFGDLVFLRDIDAGTTTLVSHDDAGHQRYGTEPHLSADGRYVTYRNEQYANGVYSTAPGFANLAGTDTVMWDRQTDITDWVIPTAAGMPTIPGYNALAISPGNNLFLFATDDDGQYAQGVVPGDGDGQQEIVLYDRAANTLRKVSELADGTNIWPGAAWVQLFLSDDGSRAFFVTDQTLLPTDTHPGADVYSIALH